MSDTSPIAPSRVVLVVAAALFDASGRVLIAKRPQGKSLAGLWEFPGGKVEPGEAPEAALIRELEEELGVKVLASALTPVSFVSHAYPDFHLLMPLYAVKQWAGEPVAREHDGLAWARPDDLHTYAMPPADAPLIAALKRFK
jgi:8-oxo-dGTP diphosphatase